MSRKRLGNLTGLRAYAALWVVAHHLTILPQISAHYSRLADAGWLGVDFFFILSGFVISYVHQQDFTSISLAPCKRFAILRLARVYPVFFVTLMLWLGLVLAVGVFAPGALPTHNFTSAKFFYQLFLLNGLGIPNSNGWNIPSWALSAEMAAYLCFPFIAFASLRLKNRRSILLIYALVIALSLFLAYRLNGMKQFMLAEEYTLFRVLSEFILGVLLYGLYQTAKANERLCNYLSLLAFLAIIALGLFPLPAAYDFLYLLVFSLLIYSAAQSSGGLACHLFSNRLVSYLGELSYCIYLIHSLVLLLVAQLVKRSPPVMNSPWLIVALAGVLASAHLLYYGVEKPARAFLKPKPQQENRPPVS